MRGRCLVGAALLVGTLLVSSACEGVADSEPFERAPEGGAAGAGGAAGVPNVASGGEAWGLGGGGAGSGSGGLAASGGSGGFTPPVRPISSPAELAERSADAYEDNQSGLIHPDTLRRWVADWSNERPPGIGGDLVVLQLGAAETALPYVPSGGGVRTYLASDLSELLEVRLNGVTAIGWSPARGVKIDGYLRRYRIDPTRDFVLFASGSAQPGDLSALAKAWLTLRYWGFSHANLGLLQGSVAEDLPDEQRAASALAAPVDGAHRVPSLGRDHFSLLASVGSVQDAVEAERAVLDVRSAEAFEGAVLSESATDETCLAGPPLCTAVYGGHVPGALHLPSAALLTADGARLRPLAELELAISSVGLGPETEVIVYDDDGGASAVAAFALLAVAGVPARWYASSFVEWGSLSSSHPEPALRALPTDSPWRTDAALTIDVWADLERGIRPLIFDPYATSSDAVIAADRAYLESPPPLPGPGDGGSGCSSD